MPKVTVLMAVYNGERYLRQAIESVLNQTFRDFEFLIINDGSVDNTQQIIISYDDPRIRLINNEQNLGLTRSLNRGLELAKGYLVARQDADDISESERLAKQVAFLETHTEVALVGTWYKKLDDQNRLIGYRKLPCDYTDIRWCLLFFCPFVHSAVMLRKSVVLEQVGFYNEALTYSQDYELWYRIARRLPVANLDEYLMRIRTNPVSMTSTYGDRTLEGYRIRVASLGSLLGWDQTKIAINETQFDILYSFLFGTQNTFSLREVQWSIEEILRLQVVFCQHYAIARATCSGYRAALYSHISSRLIDIARCSIGKENDADVLQLVGRARRLYWPIVLTKRHARLSLKLFLRGRLARLARRFARKGVN